MLAPLVEQFWQMATAMMLQDDITGRPLVRHITGDQLLAATGAPAHRLHQDIMAALLPGHPNGILIAIPNTARSTRARDISPLTVVTNASADRLLVHSDQTKGPLVGSRGPFYFLHSPKIESCHKKVWLFICHRRHYTISEDICRTSPIRELPVRELPKANVITDENLEKAD